MLETFLKTSLNNNITTILAISSNVVYDDYEELNPLFDQNVLQTAENFMMKIFKKKVK